MRQGRGYHCSGLPIACLLSGIGGSLRVEAAGGEVVAHLLVGGLYEPRIVGELLGLLGGGVAADVLVP